MISNNSSNVPHPPGNAMTASDKDAIRAFRSCIEFANSMHERKARMASLSDAVIALPGGCGTLEELLEIITWKQLGLYLNPIVILNTAGYYDPLLALLEKAVEQNFMRTEHTRMWVVATTPQDAIDALYSAPDWNGSVRKFAAI